MFGHLLVHAAARHVLLLEPWGAQIQEHYCWRRVPEKEAAHQPLHGGEWAQHHPVHSVPGRLSRRVCAERVIGSKLDDHKVSAFGQNCVDAKRGHTRAGRTSGPVVHHARADGATEDADGVLRIGVSMMQRRGLAGGVVGEHWARCLLCAAARCAHERRRRARSSEHSRDGTAV
eukprot:3240727-Prymnesium_polylepis.1